MKHYKLPEDLLIGLKDYLSRQPYAAVANAMAALSNLEPVEEETPALHGVPKNYLGKQHDEKITPKVK